VWENNCQRRLSAHGSVHSVATSAERLEARRDSDGVRCGDRAVLAPSERRTSAHRR
jgi:hypothetical protein